MSLAQAETPRSHPAAVAGAVASRLGSMRRRHLVAVPLLLFLFLLLVCAAFPSVVAPHDPISQSLLDRNLAPFSRSADGALHVLGTDSLGRDVLSRMVHGARISLGVGLASVVASSLIGIPLGIVAGYRGGRLETLIMRVVDGMLSFPVLVLCIFFLYVAGGGVVSLIVVLALMRWVAYTRVARGLTLSYRGAAFVEAAKSIGCGDARIIFRHVLPNIASPLLVLATLEVALVILAEASLSFLGLGVQPPTASWGAMVSEGRDYLATAWWLIVFPGLVIFGATLSLNLLATWARDASRAGG
jgi:peptide/nickel transport system permease protein